MSDASSEARIDNDEAGMKTMDKTKYYFNRDINPWPSPQRKPAEQVAPPKKKYIGGGFGSSYGGASIGADSSFDDFSGFAARKEKARSSLFGTGVARLAAGDTVPPSSERSATPTTSETIPNARFSYGLGSFEVASPTKRHRSGRRTGRRGRSGPGHCFHCQEHGHISRLCPKKTAEDGEFDEGEASMYLDDEPLAGAQKASSLVGRETPNLQIARLENQKARESYYGGYGYTHKERSREDNNNVAKTVNAMAAKYTGPVSPESDKFSEQLDNALKQLHVAKQVVSATNSTPPRAPTSVIPKSNKIEAPPPQPASAKTTSLGLRDRGKEISSETMTIETRRTVLLEGDTRFEETTVITFPRVLPPNVRVITAQFVPVASQVPGEIIKEKF